LIRVCLTQYNRLEYITSEIQYCTKSQKEVQATTGYHPTIAGTRVVFILESCKLYAFNKSQRTFYVNLRKCSDKCDIKPINRAYCDAIFYIKLYRLNLGYKV